MWHQTVEMVPQEWIRRMSREASVQEEEDTDEDMEEERV